MPIGTMTENRTTCKLHVRSPKPCRTFATITLSKRKGLRATICSNSRRKGPYSRRSRIINVIADKRVYFGSCYDALPTLLKIARKPKVM